MAHQHNYAIPCHLLYISTLCSSIHVCYCWHCGICCKAAIKAVPWTRRDVTYMNYDIMKQEITKVHKALHRQMKAFSQHLRQPVLPLLTDTDSESVRSSSVDCRLRHSSRIDVSRYCVDANEVYCNCGWFIQSCTVCANILNVNLKSVLFTCMSVCFH